MKIIHMFNEKTLFMSSSLSQFNQVRNALDLHHIKYKYRTTNHAQNSFAPGRGTVRGMGGNTSVPSTLYEIVVHKDDYDKACCLLPRRK